MAQLADRKNVPATKGTRQTPTSACSTFLNTKLLRQQLLQLMKVASVSAPIHQSLKYLYAHLQHRMYSY
jgi:hypothetical protein